MEWQDILRRIDEGEDQQTEFKRGLGDLSSVGKAICAFTNSEGGVVVLGVSDAREVVGVKEAAERVRERLTSFLQTGCSAPVYARLGGHATPNGWTLVGGGTPTGVRAHALRRSRLDSPWPQQR